MRTFVNLRLLLSSHEELALKLVELERNYDAKSITVAADRVFF